MFNLLQIKFCTSDFFLFNSLIIHFCLNILNQTLSDHLKLILMLCAEASHCDHDSSGQRYVLYLCDSVHVNVLRGRGRGRGRDRRIEGEMLLK